MRNLFVSLGIVGCVLALIYWALPATAQVEFKPLYQPAPGLYDFQPMVPLYQPVVVPDAGTAHRNWMRNFEAEQARRDESYQRMVERNRYRIQQSERSFLERCAQYNRGCLRKLLDR